LTPPTKSRDGKILQAAIKWIRCDTNIKDICINLGINLDANGTYLKSNGQDYKRIQTAKRKLLKQQMNDEKVQEINQLKKNMQQLKQKLLTVTRERDEAFKEIKDLTEYVNSLSCPPHKKTKL
jgi:septal ring factor EnvC (AmiA/AmiB activator)